MSDTKAAGPDQERIRPFYCGSQFADWESLNCDRCVKGYDNDAGEFRCDLQEAIGLAYIGDGTITPAVATAIGHTDAHEGGEHPSGWPCSTYEPREGYCAHHRKNDEEPCPHCIAPPAAQRVRTDG